MRISFALLAASFQAVFRDWRFVGIAVLLALAVFLFAVYAPNIKLVWQVLTLSSAGWGEKLAVLVSLAGSLRTNFMPVGAFFTISIAVLFGINAAMLAYYLRERKRIVAESGTAVGFGGLVAGILGIGCSACGSLLLTPFLAALGAGGALALLPFGGEEIGAVGVALLALSLFLLAKKIEQGPLCEIN